MPRKYKRKPRSTLCRRALIRNQWVDEGWCGTCHTARVYKGGRCLHHYFIEQLAPRLKRWGYTGEEAKSLALLLTNYLEAQLPDILRYLNPGAPGSKIAHALFEAVPFDERKP